MGPETSCVDNALRDTFVVEVENLFTKMEVLKRSRPPRANPERVLVVGNRNALLRCENGPLAARDLVDLATFALMNRLVCEMRGGGTRGSSLALPWGLPLGAWLLLGWDLRRAVALRGGVTHLQNCPWKALFRASAATTTLP